MGLCKSGLCKYGSGVNVENVNLGRRQVFLQVIFNALYTGFLALVSLPWGSWILVDHHQRKNRFSKFQQICSNGNVNLSTSDKCQR